MRFGISAMLRGCVLLVLTVVSQLWGAEHLLFTGSSDQRTAEREAQELVSLRAVRLRKVNLNPALQSPADITKGDRLILDLFDEATYIADIDRVNVNVNGTVSVRGRVNGYPLSYVLISTTGERSLGSIRIPERGQRYIIQSGSDGVTHYLVEPDVTKIDELEDGPVLIPPITERGTYEGFESIPLGGPLDPALIDVMVVYTPAARQWADDNSSGIANVIAQAMEEGQLALDNSGTFASIQLVHSAEVSYVEDSDSLTNLNRLTSTNDGFIDVVHTWRDTYEADLVDLFTVVDDWGGYACTLGSALGEPERGFSVTRVQQVATGYNLIHEIGHNMGCGHYKWQDTQPGPALFDYSAGWRWRVNDVNYCSVMSYSHDGNYKGTRVAHFSNPSILYQGVPTGHSVDGDNARTIRETKHVIAAYRQLYYTLRLYKTGNGRAWVNGIGLYPLPWSWTFTSGTNVTLQAVPNSGWRFSHWSGDLSGSTNPTSIQMNGNRNITANFRLYSGGSGTEEDPYQINTVADWQELMGAKVHWDKHFILTSDLDLQGIGIFPIGNDYPDSVGGRAFSGSFDGNGHIIRNAVVIEPYFGGSLGLFGYVDENGKLNDLGVENITTTSDNYFGGLVGKNEGTLSTCYATGSVTGGAWAVGGLVGYNHNGNLSDCYATADVNAAEWYVGGLVGYNHNGNLTDCYATGSVAGSGDSYDVGGLVGYNEDGEITSCFATGSVSGYSYVGGLVGENSGTVTDCYATGIVSGRNAWAGALVGTNHSTITTCWATGSVSSSYGAGGLVGWNDGNITECYATGFVRSAECVGGLVGSNSGPVGGCYAANSGISGSFFVGGLVGENYGNLTNCYATGSVSGSQLVGGLVGKNGGPLTNCYATGSVNGTWSVGGLVGNNGGNLTACSATGSVSGFRPVGGLVGNNSGNLTACYANGSVTGGDWGVGGLVGRNYGSLTDCYATGSASCSGEGDYVGGLVGENYGNLTNCYATGRVSGDRYVGGLVGRNEAGFASASFWDIESCGWTTSASGTGKTTAEMKTRSTFTDAGWDFVNIWDICEGTNYPRLLWQIPSADWVCPDGVGFEDFSYLAEEWPIPDNGDSPANLDGDEAVRFGDLMIFCEQWLMGR